MKLKFPEIAAELLRLEAEDQHQVRGQHVALQQAPSDEARADLELKLAKACHMRARRLLELLGTIGEPTVAAIGLSGSKAVSTLALHSYLAAMEQVLERFERVYRENPGAIYLQAIPPLSDRLMIARHWQQSYGTNWFTDSEGAFFLIPIQDFETVNQRRARYRLGPIKRPVVLSTGQDKYPRGRGVAKASDQKALTDEEYARYTKYLWEPLA